METFNIAQCTKVRENGAVGERGERKGHPWRGGR